MANVPEGIASALGTNHIVSNLMNRPFVQKNKNEAYFMLKLSFDHLCRLMNCQQDLNEIAHCLCYIIVVSF